MPLPKLTALLPAPPPPPAIVPVPGDCFFVRRIPLAADTEAGPQIELALEGLSPFAPAQLYWGALVAEDRSAALVYAAYRKRIATDEWDRAAAVLPDFLALCGPREPETVAELHRAEGRLTIVIRTGDNPLPAAVLVRADAAPEALVAEAAARAGLDRVPRVREVDGELFARSTDDGRIELGLGEAAPLVIAAEAADLADVRDDDFLEARRRTARRDQWLWRGLQIAAALLVLAAVLDVTAGALRWRTGSLAGRVQAQTPDVQRIETAQTLVSRIAELGERRLMPMEMLAAINPGRPDSIQFQRTVTRGVHGLEIEARTGNAADVGSYENTLRALPEIASVATRDIRARDGQTSFVLSLDFRTDAFKAVESGEEGGAL
ncbi:MAG: hypothetical protein ABII82_06455 [Verrucomicrobiota bacterium]